MQGKSKHPKTQLSVPSLGDGLEMKEILFLRGEKKPLMALDKEIPHVGGTPPGSAGGPLWVAPVSLCSGITLRAGAVVGPE